MRLLHSALTEPTVFGVSAHDNGFKNLNAEIAEAQRTQSTSSRNKFTLVLAFPAEKLHCLNLIESSFPSRLCALALSLCFARFEAIALGLRTAWVEETFETR
jgi:hypothetical protein